MAVALDRWKFAWISWDFIGYIFEYFGIEDAGYGFCFVAVGMNSKFIPRVQMYFQ